MRDFNAIYRAIEQNISTPTPCITAQIAGRAWAYVETLQHAGIAMMTPGDSRPPMLGKPEGTELRRAATATGSWNLTEASFALAAANAWYNTPQRIKALDCGIASEIYPTDGLDFRGKTVGIVGHMEGPQELWEQAAAIYRIERTPQQGDYPDAACDLLLPQCEIVLITGSSIINKTLPHLLELCENAVTVLMGPSVPLCPALLELGIDRLSGMAVTDREGLRRHVAQGCHGSPYPYGASFLLKK